MRRATFFGFLLIAVLIAPMAFAQTPTVVSGTITDPNGLPYSYARVSAQLIPTTATPTIQVGGIPVQIGGQNNATTDASGSFSMNLFCNSAGGGCSVISPSGTLWQFTVTLAPGIPPPAGTGPQSFSATLTISGASQNISANLNAAAKPLSAATTPAGQLAIDSGNRANESPLSNGGNWTVLSSNVTPHALPLQLVNGLFQGTQATGLNQWATSIWTGTAFPANQYAQCTVQALTSSGGAVNGGLFLRAQTNAGGDATAYTGQIQGTALGAGVTLLISYIVNGSEVNLTTTTATVNAGDTLRFEALGNVLTLKLNGVVKLTAIDGRIFGGQPGLHTFNAAQPNSSVILGNFSAGSLTPQISGPIGDQFPQPNENPLSSFGAWSTITGMGSLQAVSNKAEPALANSNSYMVYSGLQWADTQSAQITVNTLATGSDWVSPLVHAASGQEIFYQLIVYGPTGNTHNILLVRVNPGFTTILTISATVNVNDTFKLAAADVQQNGTQNQSVVLTVYQNGIQIGQVTDSASNNILTGYVGAGAFGSAAVGNAVFSNFIANNPPLPPTLPSIDLTAQGAAIGATTLYAVPSSAGGQYRICMDSKVTQAATTSSALGGAGGFQLLYTDKDDSVVVTTVAALTPNTTTANLALNTTQAQMDGCYLVNAKASTNIQYQMGYTSVGATPMQYNLHIRIEAL